jgi:hypothetical protein
MREIGEYFNLHYTTVSGIIRNKRKKGDVTLLKAL